MIRIAMAVVLLCADRCPDVAEIRARAPEIERQLAAGDRRWLEALDDLCGDEVACREEVFRAWQAAALEREKRQQDR